MQIRRGRNLAPLLALMIGTTTAVATPATMPATTPATTPAAATEGAAAPKAPAVSPDVASYDLGLMLGSQLEHSGLAGSLSLDALVRGLREAVGGRTVTAEEREAAVQFMRSGRESLAGKNRAAAREFLAHNAKQPGVVTMPSGLQYRVLAEGDSSGKSPGPTDQVTVRYRASLADGTEFDRSDTHGQPATFRVNSVLKGWQEAFLAMKPGAKWQLFVPPDLGYGNNTPPMVPPGSLLVYELELQKVEAAPPMDLEAAKRGPATKVPAPKAVAPAASAATPPR